MDMYDVIIEEYSEKRGIEGQNLSNIKRIVKDTIEGLLKDFDEDKYGCMDLDMVKAFIRECVSAVLWNVNTIDLDFESMSDEEIQKIIDKCYCIENKLHVDHYQGVYGTHRYMRVYGMKALEDKGYIKILNK